MQAIDSPFHEGSLELVAFDRRSGAIAISSSNTIKVYEELVTFDPDHATGAEAPDARHKTREELNIRWHNTLESIVQGSYIKSLSWGLDRELLVGNDSLSLLHPPSSSPGSTYMRSSWTFPISAEIETAQFSPDASFIASHGRHDRLIKVWRRLTDRVTSTGLKTSDFDFIYLPHDRAVSEVRWRQPFHEDLLVDNIVYTNGLDSKLRAWASDIPHDGHLLTLHETIPLVADARDKTHIPIVLDDDVLSWALAKASKREAGNRAYTEAAALLGEISKGQPEVILTVSPTGSMSAYVLHNLGNRNHKESSQRLFFQRDRLNFWKDGDNNSDLSITATVQRVGCCDLLFVVYRTESISIYEADLFNLFSRESDCPVLTELIEFSGHAKPIMNLQALAGERLLSRDIAYKSIHWSRLHQHLSSTKSEETRIPAGTSNDDAVPEYLSSCVSPSLCASNEDSVAIVEITKDSTVQIWGSSLPTSYSGSPETVLDFGTQIQAIKWSPSEIDSRTRLLSVCTSHSIYLCRLQYIDAEEVHPWVISWSFDLAELTRHPITHTVFLADDFLALAAGPQIFTFTANDWKTSGIAAAPLLANQFPVYHPMFLKQVLSLGKLRGARLILATLHDQLVDSSEIVNLDNYLGLSGESIFAVSDNLKYSSSLTKTKYNALFENQASSTAAEEGVLSISKATSLESLLQDLEIPHLDHAQKNWLATIAIALIKIQPEEPSLDEFGLRFYLSYSILLEQNKREPTGSGVLSDEDVLWAYKSKKQDILLTLVKSSVKALTWKEAKAAKIFHWLKDRSALLDVVETIARAEFLKGEERNPVAASLWYLALHKKSVLLSLWRTSGTHPEHNLTTKILSNDFELPKWRTAANKNAFALIGRRRYEYAAAWFLLGSSLKDAVSVCIRNLEDLDLALAISRIYSDDLSETTRTVVISNILEFAKSSGSRLLGCWCHEFLGNLQSSMDTLMSPFSKTTKDTPAIATLYLNLRSSLGADPREPGFVEYVAYLLRLRGCSLISEYISKTWTHEASAPISTSGQTGHRTTEVTVEEYKARQKEKLVEAPKAVFEEPTMDSFAAFDF